jgi:hypothetical protein
MLNQSIIKKNVMRTRNSKLTKFIPVDNNINKAIAFANTLDVNNIRNVQRIKTKEFYIPTLEVIEKLQGEGWNITGVNEQRGSNRKITNNYVQMQHPDFAIKNSKGKSEALASITITNSCNGNKPLQLDLGVYRQVCSNGMIAFDSAAESEKIKHIQANYYNLDQFISNISRKTSTILNEFEKLKHTDLSVTEMRKLAYEAATLRYNNLEDINIDDLLSINRIEDEGNSLWTVFNRIQENLTADVSNLNEDIRLNKQLFAIADRYALAV